VICDKKEFINLVIWSAIDTTAR